MNHFLPRGYEAPTSERRSAFFFFIRWLQVAFIAICYMFIDVFALQHIADRPSVNIAINAHIAVLL